MLVEAQHLIKIPLDRARGSLGEQILVHCVVATAALIR